MKDLPVEKLLYNDEETFVNIEANSDIYDKN